MSATATAATAEARSYFCLHIAAVFASAVDMHDPLVRESLFAAANAPLGLRATPDLVDSFLILQHRVDELQPQRQHLELLYNTFGSPQDGLELQQQADELVMKTRPLPRLAEEESATASLSCAVKAAADDTSRFSVAALQRKLLLLPPHQSQLRRECSSALRHLLYECDESQPPHHQQHQQGNSGAAEACLSTLLRGALETFPIALSEALELAGLINPEGPLLMLLLLLR